MATNLRSEIPVRLKPVSLRVLTATYAIALLIIAGLSIASHTVLDYALLSDEGSAAIINQAGRQRMLSQRIAGLAAQYRLGDTSAAQDLRSAVAAFESSHEALAQASQIGSANDASTRQLRELYFAGDNSLDAQMRSYVADARRVADLSPQDPAMPALLSRLFAQARSPLLATLEKVVSIHQADSERRMRHLEYLQWSILAIVLLTLTLEAMVIFRPMIRRIVTYTRELLRLATTDPLTGAPNRRSFMERCQVEIERARRHGRPLCLLMLDIDRFKTINDTYGHIVGDEVLRVAGEHLLGNLRKSDILGRLGGEEFAVLMVETTLSDAARLAEQMREQFAALTMDCAGQPVEITVSVGVTSLIPDARGLDNALRVADNLMYRAKQTGRNRIVIADAPDTVALIGA